MISTETVKFIGFLNMLAEKSKYGIHPLSTATAQDRKGLLYDDKKPTKVNSDNLFSRTTYPLISGSLTWTEEYASDGVKIVVMIDDDEPFIHITSEYDNNPIIVEDGAWFRV